MRIAKLRPGKASTGKARIGKAKARRAMPRRGVGAASGGIGKVGHGPTGIYEKETVMVAATTIDAKADTKPDALALATSELEPAEATVLRADISDFLGRVTVLRERAKGIKVTGRGQAAEEKMARVVRLALRAERVEGLKRCKELKASSLRRGRALDGVAAVIREMIEPVEEYLLTQESYTERADAADRDLLTASRRETLTAFGADASVYATLGDLGDDAWATLLESAMSARDAKIEAARQEAAIRAEVERIAAEKREAERQERIKAEAERVAREKASAEENARLRAEAADREAAAQAERSRVEAERAAARAKADEAAALAKAEKDRELAAAREETDKAARALAKAQAEAAQAKAAAEQATREREAADAARAAAEADARKPTAKKYAVLVKALTEIARAGGEPIAAKVATDALETVGLGR